MKLSKEYILNNLAREDLWTPGSKGTFTYGHWLITLKREDDRYGPYKFAIEAQKEIPSRALTYETKSRRYVSMEKAFLHILNHFNENANIKDKYDHIDFDVLSTIKDLPSSSFENPTITLNFGNIVSELENKNLKLLHIKDNPGLFVVDSKDNLYAIETYHAGGYLDRYIGEKHIISFEQIEHPVRNFEEWRKTYWDAAWVKDFIERIVPIKYPNLNVGESIGCNGSDWVVTDPDDLQLRRQVQGDNQKVFELIQVDVWPIDEKTSYKLAVGEVDLNDYSEEEIKSTLDSFGYDNMEALVSAVGSEKEAYGQLAEMFFETYTTDFYVCEFDSWNAAVDEVDERTGMDLAWVKEVEKPDLESVIKSCSEMSKDVKRDITDKGTINKDER